MKLDTNPNTKPKAKRLGASIGLQNHFLKPIATHLFFCGMSRLLSLSVFGTFSFLRENVFPNHLPKVLPIVNEQEEVQEVSSSKKAKWATIGL